MEEWDTYTDPSSGAPYYVNRRTKESVWQLPEQPAAPPPPPPPARKQAPPVPPVPVGVAPAAMSPRAAPPVPPVPAGAPAYEQKRLGETGLIFGLLCSSCLASWLLFSLSLLAAASSSQ